jgi:hypothetical protein
VAEIGVAVEEEKIETEMTGIVVEKLGEREKFLIENEVRERGVTAELAQGADLGGKIGLIENRGSGETQGVHFGVERGLSEGKKHDGGGSSESDNGGGERAPGRAGGSGKKKNGNESSNNGPDENSREICPDGKAASETSAKEIEEEGPRKTGMRTGRGGKIAPGAK